VIDGGKGLRKAIRVTFGSWALVQRCQIHKLRNVAGHLPKHRQAWVTSAMRQAWKLGSEAKARHRLEQLAAQLDSEHPAAAASIREGLEETLTVIKVGVGGWLLKTFRSTNPIENLQGTIQRVVRNVKRWRGGSMAMRFLAAPPSNNLSTSLSSSIPTSRYAALPSHPGHAGSGARWRRRSAP
jgi:transposase-like protein